MIRLILVLLASIFLSCGQLDSYSNIYSVRIQTEWDYSDWPWLKDVDRDLQMSKEDGIKFYDSLAKLALDEKRFKIAIKDGYDAVPWARSAPCATTTSAVLEQAFKDVGMESRAAIFGKHDQFGPTHNVEIILYRMGWNYWPKSNWKSKIAIGMLGGRYLFHGTPKHSGHIYTILSEIDEKYDLIGDNGGYNHHYRAPGWEAGTEGFWLPPGIYPDRRI